MRALALAIVLAPAVARADGWRGVELGGAAGVGTPLGTVGLELETVVYRTLAIAGGVGLGPGGSAVALQPRLFQHDDGSGFYGGLGASISGEHFPMCQSAGDCIIDPNEDGTAYWVNAEAGYEKHWGGAYVRGFVGFSLMLDKSSVCLDYANCDAKVPYLGVAIGAVIGDAAPTPVERAPEPTVQPPGATPSNDPRLPQLTDDARTAATRWRCDLVRDIDKQVASIDRAYHDRVFVEDSAIAACLE
jgi:hypothetical protein